MEEKNKTNWNIYFFRKAVFLCLAVFFIYLMQLFIKPIDRHIFNAGNFIGIVGCGILAFLCLLNEQVEKIIKKVWKKKIGKFITIILMVLVSLGIITVSIFSILMGIAINNQPKSPKPLVVLGCKIEGSNPSEMLYRRLEAADEYLKENKEAICVVTGGQGSNEIMPEVVVMKNYLVSQGIDEDRIFVEENSKNTYENIKFSKKILDEVHPTDEIIIVTDGFHQFRASFIASQVGLKSYAVNAKTNPDYVPTYWVREWMGIAKDLLLSAF